MALLDPIFIDTDPQAVLDAIIADYEFRTSKPLEPGQAERIIIDIMAYRESVLRSGIQDSAKQNLLAFARAPMLDYLGDFLGVKRLAAASATVTVALTLSAGSGALVIPEGTRIRSTDGLAVFQLIAPLSLGAGVTAASALFIAQTPGEAANGYTSGNISVIMDPLPYLISVSNTVTSNGGSDQESDDELRDRIRLAPSAFSTAGPTGAYEYHAKSAHPSIIDVSVDSLLPGDVDIYILSSLGIPAPSGVLTAVTTALNAEKIRPLSDTVNVHNPTPITYALSVELIRYADADQPTVEAQVLAALTAYANECQTNLHHDVVLSQIMRVINNLDGVYDATILLPVANVTTTISSVAICTGITVITTGVH